MTTDYGFSEAILTAVGLDPAKVRAVTYRQRVGEPPILTVEVVAHHADPPILETYEIVPRGDAA